MVTGSGVRLERAAPRRAFFPSTQTPEGSGVTIDADQFQAVARDIQAATHERSLELSLAVVCDLFERLSGDDLRDAIVRLVAELENEARLKSVLAVSILRSSGIAASSPILASLIERAER